MHAVYIYPIKKQHFLKRVTEQDRSSSRKPRTGHPPGLQLRRLPGTRGSSDVLGSLGYLLEIVWGQ